MSVFKYIPWLLLSFLTLAITHAETASNEQVNIYPDTPFSPQDIQIINQWVTEQKMGGHYFIDSYGKIGFQEDDLLREYRTQSIEELRQIVKIEQSYQARIALVEKLVEDYQPKLIQHSFTNDEKTTRLQEIETLVFNLTVQGNVSSLPLLIDLYMLNGQQAIGRHPDQTWQRDELSYKNAIKHLYVLERRGNIGFQRYQHQILDNDPIFRSLPHYQQIIEQGHKEGEQSYFQLAQARATQSLPPFNNQVPNAMNHLYDYVAAPFIDMEREALARIQPAVKLNHAE